MEVWSNYRLDRGEKINFQKQVWLPVRRSESWFS